MIRGISHLKKINKAVNKNMQTKFNNSLPISIEVLQQNGYNIYELLLGTKKFTTKSEKKLTKGKKYWGDFGETKDGIITISSLIQKPDFLQKFDNFLDLDINEFLNELSKSQNILEEYKNWIIATLANENIKKDGFKTLSTMLLALKENIIHLPLKSEQKYILLQIKAAKDSFNFYSAYENLGPIYGTINLKDKNTKINLHVIYKKSAIYLAKEIENFDIVTNISIVGDIKPLYTAKELKLDLQG